MRKRASLLRRTRVHAPVQARNVGPTFPRTRPVPPVTHLFGMTTRLGSSVVGFIDSALTEPRRFLLNLMPGSLMLSRSEILSSGLPTASGTDGRPCDDAAGVSGAADSGTQPRGSRRPARLEVPLPRNESVPFAALLEPRGSSVAAYLPVAVTMAGTAGAAAAAPDALASRSVMFADTPSSRRSCSVASACAMSATGRAGRCVNKYVSTSYNPRKTWREKRRENQQRKEYRNAECAEKRVFLGNVFLVPHTP